MKFVSPPIDTLTSLTPQKAGSPLPLAGERKKDLSKILGVFLLAVGVLMLRIRDWPLKNWDEAWYAEQARNMASGGHDLLVPWWNGQFYFDKPPLYFWLTGIVMKIFGDGEWQARIISVLAGAVAVTLVYLISKRFLAVIIFLSLGQVVLRFGEGDVDSLLICLFLATYYFFMRGSSKKNAIFSGIFLGLSILVKGWSISLFVVLLLVLNINKQKFWKYTIVLTLITAGWWYVLGAFTYGQKFIDWYVLHPSANNFSSLLPNLDWFYVKTLVSDWGVWGILIVLIAISFVSRYKPHPTLPLAGEGKTILISCAVYFV